jgi:hypothetical protein
VFPLIWVLQLKVVVCIQKQDYKTALRKHRKAMMYLDLCWEKDEMDEGCVSIF